MDVAIGTRLGGYTLLRKLGSGGMGAVYLAEDPAIGQQVAIKVIRTDSDAHIDTVSEIHAAELFRREARAVASLDHLHILPLYRYGEEETDGTRRAFMVMQYRPEGSLWDWLRYRASITVRATPPSTFPLPPGLPDRWPLSVEESAEYLRQAASALHYAHERGIVHRDVKPANFLLRIDAQSNSVFLLLSDFGLAKFYNATSATSTLFGTPTYMAPEQFEGEVIPESDQYALAVMIYYLLAGRPPFEGEPIRLMHQHLSVEPPPIRTLIPGIPATIENVLQRALAKQAGARYPSTLAFADAFRQAIHQTSLSAPTLWTQPSISPAPASVSPSADLPPAMRATILPDMNVPQPVKENTPDLPTVHQPPAPAASTTNPSSSFATTIYTPPRPTLSQEQPASQAALPPTPPPSEPEQKNIGRRGALGWIVGGTAVVLAAGIGTGAYIYLNQRSATTSAPPIPYPIAATPHRSPQVALKHIILSGHTAGITSLSWSPDGIHLASSSKDGTVRLWNTTTQQSPILSYQGHRSPVSTVVWGPTGQQLASGATTVQVWNPGGKLTHPVFGVGGAAISDLSWQPDESALFASTIGNGLYELKMAGNTALQLGSKSSHHTLAVSPDGQYLALGTEQGVVGIYELPTLHHIKDLPQHTLPVLALAWSSNSQMLASTAEDRTTRVWNMLDGSIESLTHTSIITSISWEPGSISRLATASGNSLLTIWTITKARAIPISYQGHAGPCTAVAWGPKAIATGSTDKTVIIWSIE